MFVFDFDIYLLYRIVIESDLGALKIQFYL